jgi:L-iditol 2-dehydrogenase
VRVARLHAAGDLRVDEEPVPAPDTGTSLVRVTAVGICGSDLHWWDEGAIGDAVLAHPLVLGHEGAGVIAEGPRRGERVAIDPAIADGTCRACRDGYPNLCYRIRFAGHGETDGMMREFMTWPTELLNPLPDGVTDADGALLEPLGVALHSVDLGHLPFAGTASVVGCGPIGLLLIQLLKAAGAASVLAIEPLAHRREAASRYGADAVISPGPALDLRELVGAGVDVAFEVAGADEAVRLAIESVRPGGRVVLAGIPGDDAIRFQASVARRKGLTIAMVRRMNQVYPRAISLAARGTVDLGSLVTRRAELNDAKEAFADAARRTGLKVLVEPLPRARGSGRPRLLLRAGLRDHRAGGACARREPGRDRVDGVAVPGRAVVRVAGGAGLAAAVGAEVGRRGRVARRGRTGHGAAGGSRAGQRGGVRRRGARVPRAVPARVAGGGPGSPAPYALTGTAAAPTSKPAVMLSTWASR